MTNPLAALKGASLAHLGQLEPDQLATLLDLADRVKAEPERYAGRLQGKVIALLFEKHSTRTRVSFEAGIRQLGGAPIFLSRNEIQLGRGEPIRDTARVLSGYVDGIVLRTFAQERFDEMADYADIPVVNALTDRYHPCQILADLQTMRAHLGTLAGKSVAWVGDGNNVAHSMALGCALAGMHFRAATPEGYACDPEVIGRARIIAGGTGGLIEEGTVPEAAVRGAHAVVTDVFASMGQEEEAGARLEIFRPFQVNAELMALAAPGALFLHCLPAHRGEEVTEAVLEGPQSVVWEEAQNRLHAQKALLLALYGVAQ